MWDTQLFCIYLPVLTKGFSKERISHLSRNFVMSIASESLKVPKKLLHLKVNQFGKPYLQDYENWHFNISHTNEMMIIGISDKPIGVDIEKIRNADFRIAKQFFTEKENLYIHAFNEKQDKRFFEIWTKKESYLKYTGYGLTVPLKSLDVCDYYHMFTTLEYENFIITICNDNKLSIFFFNIFVLTIFYID